MSGPARPAQRLTQPPSRLLQEVYGAPHLAADALNFRHQLAADRAHTVMLVERNIVSGPDGQALLRVLGQVEVAGVDVLRLRPELNDLFTCLEAHLVETLGEAVGGRLHTGRSRNDLFMAIARMAARESIDRVIEEILTLQATLLTEARTQAATIFPGYTHHSQQAQPVTYGHFLLGHHDALSRDVARLEAAYGRVNQCPLGGAALAGTGFPIDRERVADLLGFEGLVEHTGDACGSRDFQLEFGAALAIVGSNLGRLAESLILFTASELGYVELADEVSSVSSIMPQKKNPVSLEMVEALGARAAGHLSAMFTILKSTTLGMSREVGYCDGELMAMVRDIDAGLRLMTAGIATLRLHPERALASIERSFATATELADVLVRTRDLSFRQAHHVVARVIATVVAVPDGAITPASVDEAARALLGHPLQLTEAELRTALDPRLSVDVRRTRGGPAPSEVLRMVEARQSTLAHTRRRQADRQAALDLADQALRSAVAALES